MSDPSAASAATNAGEYSVSEISGAIKRTVEDTFGYVRVRGEISGFRGQHSSGHAYFALKDEKARMEAVIWRGVFNKLKVKPEEGMEVIATGKVTTYPGSSKYQIVIERLEPAGVGALMALLEERKKKLQAEGIFDPARKQLLPYLPKVIGVVTSPTGAVIRDIMHRLSDRFPVHVLLWPVRVQGETSGAEVAAAIRGFNALDALSSLPKPDVLIVARGGGSLEDLWGFNDEAVVRAAAESDIPLISAVGHETDWTLIDYAADVRAPTPTGAAEMAVPVRSELISTLGDLHARNEGAVLRYVERQRTHLGALARALPNRDSLLALPRQRLDAAAARIPGALQRSLFEAQSRLARAGDRLSPQTLSQRIVRERQKVETLNLRLGTALEKRADSARSRLSLATARMRVDALADAANRRRERLLLLNERRTRAYEGQLERKAERVARASSLIEALSYKNVLNRGFAVVRDTSGKSITKAANVTEGAGYEVQFADGSANVTAGESGKPIAKPAPKRSKKAAASSDGQGSLF